MHFPIIYNTTLLIISAIISAPINDIIAFPPLILHEVEYALYIHMIIQMKKNKTGMESNPIVTNELISLEDNIGGVFFALESLCSRSEFSRDFVAKYDRGTAGNMAILANACVPNTSIILKLDVENS